MNSIVASFLNNWLIIIIQAFLVFTTLGYAFYDFKKEALRRSKAFPVEAKMVMIGILLIAVFTVLLSGYRNYRDLHSPPFPPSKMSLAKFNASI